MKSTHDRLKAMFIGRDAEESREKKLTEQVELRKSKRMDVTFKNRNLRGRDIEWIDIEKLPAEEYSIEKLEEYIECIKHENRKVNLAGVYGIRKIISNPKFNSLSVISESGVVGLVSSFMYMDNYPQLQYETAWLIGNMCTGTSEQIEVIVKHGCFSGLAYMLNSSITEVKEQAFWALGNMATDSSKFRDLLLEPAVFENLIKIVMSVNTPIRLLKQGCWTLSCICRIKPIPRVDICEKLTLPMTKGLLMYNEIKENTEDVLHAIISMITNYSQLISKFDDKDVIAIIMRFVYGNDLKLCVLSLKIIGNFIAGEDKQADTVIKSGALKALKYLAPTQEIEIKKEVFWCISNLCAGNYLQLEALWSSGLISFLVKGIQSQPFIIKKDICWSLFNLIANSFLYLEELIDQGLFTSISHLLSLQDAKIARVSISCLSRCLDQIYSDHDLYHKALALIHETGLISQLIDLQTHSNEKVFSLTYALLEKHFDNESEYESVITNLPEFSKYHI